ncbi:hypothetical protein ACIQC9_09615 [Brevundimonas sp. NPDC092305]|uniref:hypothetical protein n=1 Tax=Brevundimonas sp. NPDC092305 TaxID=3363957 RepID=UPI003829828C
MTTFPIHDTPVDREAARVCQSLHGRFFYTGTDVVQLNAAWAQVAEGLSGDPAAMSAFQARFEARRGTGDPEVFARIEQLVGNLSRA